PSVDRPKPAPTVPYQTTSPLTATAFTIASSAGPAAPPTRSQPPSWFRSTHRPSPCVPAQNPRLGEPAIASTGTPQPCSSCGNCGGSCGVSSPAGPAGG